ncbi:TrkH family potassium uptake protein [Lactococcus hodotermopsidis]|uniref:TrkH family potassium uptake protein n=1 Tax=Pseudolactococcus hodotermopsidis TaxID=2709157 RepID=UPI0015576FF6|nr:potassium transporter TrkG [Lactococcus hodotermopsidis]
MPRFSSFFKNLKPPQLIILGFLSVIIAGSILLALPLSDQNGQATSYLDSLFMAVSATCVTGLAVVNTADHWNKFGQVIIMLMVEVGGLGFMSFLVLLLNMTEKHSSFKSKMLIRDAYNFTSFSNGVGLVKSIIKLSLVTQLIGAVLLSFDFVPKFGWLDGIWYSVFHAISAHSNAGFDLFETSLFDFRDNSYVLSIMSLLILSGSFGFIVWFDLLNFRKTHKMTLHSRLALHMTAILVILGTFLYSCLNFKNFDGHPMNFLAQNFFLSITPRSGGFSFGSYSTSSYDSLLLTMILMFIGGTSGSTAGGVKTTTFGILLLDLRTIFSNREKTIYHERRVPRKTISRVYEIIFIYIAIIFTSSFVLLITEQLPRNNGIEYVFFEVISALATVGLSLGLTPELSIFGKILIMCLMFVGRIGIMTVIYAASRHNRIDEELIQYPEEEIVVG